MAIVSKSIGAIGAGSISTSKKCVFLIIDFLRTSTPNGVNWMVIGSSDGITGGMAVDLIIDPSSFALGSWIVLQPPHNAYQVLISRVGLSGDSEFKFSFNPASDYIGGSSGVEPTSPSSRSYLCYSGVFVNNGNAVVQLSADSSAPYGVAIYIHAWHFGNSALAGFGIFPLDFENSGGHPYVFYIVGNQVSSYNTLSLNNNNPLNSPVKAETSDGTQFLGYKAVKLTNSNGTNSTFAGWRIEDADATDTIYFGNSNARYGFKGSSQFIQWIHTAYNTPTTFNDRRKIVYQDVVVPWDGFTIPDTSPVINFI